MVNSPYEYYPNYIDSGIESIFIEKNQFDNIYKPQ